MGVVQMFVKYILHGVLCTYNCIIVHTIHLTIITYNSHLLVLGAYEK
jgi:hypothetical protein